MHRAGQSSDDRATIGDTRNSSTKVTHVVVDMAHSWGKVRALNPMTKSMSSAGFRRLDFT
jgi:hypothetical protein